MKKPDIDPFKDLFNAEIRQKSQSYRIAQRSFEEDIAHHSRTVITDQIDQLERERKAGDLRKEIDKIKKITCTEIVVAAKLIIIDACRFHHEQYEKLGLQPSGSEYTFNQFLKYHRSDQSVLPTDNVGGEQIETVSFRMARNMTLDSQEEDLMDVHFLLPNHFIIAANSGSIETRNWLDGVTGIIMILITKGKPVESYSISCNDAYKTDLGKGGVVEQALALTAGEEQKITDNMEQLEVANYILPRLANMQLVPSAEKNIPIPYNKSE